MNPFVNLLDPELHTVDFLRAKSKFLFTVLMMAASRWWSREHYEALRIMSVVFSVRCVSSSLPIPP